VLSGFRNRWAFLAIASVLVSAPARTGSNSSQLPDGPGKETVQRICAGCHAPEIVLTHRDTKDGWEQVVTSMVDKGANGTDAEFNTIIDYLASHFPKNTDSKPPAKSSDSKSR